VCGISGLVSPAAPADPDLVARMTETLVHRGPDSGGVTALGRCVLGHRRLRIVDLETGDQPVTSESGDVVAVFNGELYDFHEIRHELDALGHEVPGTGDTAVIPHVYEEHGTGFPAALEGMFAIALWDRERERLVLARDRLGKKPLHWVELPDGGLAFASELKALFQLPGLRRELDPAALDAYLALQYVPGEDTGVGGIRRLAPGHVLVWEDGRLETHRYWELRPDTREFAEEDWLELVRARVTAAVRRRLVSDVPLGALLSGGIDSTIVVGLMAQESTNASPRASPRAPSERHTRSSSSSPTRSSSSRGSRPSSTSPSATRRSCRPSSSPRWRGGT
jgi:asparagine synthase (glutamine-hydrolysing)